MFECAFEVIMLHFVEAIHVELSDEAIHFFVSEISGQDNLLEFDDVFDDELKTVGGPVNNLLILFDLNYGRSTLRS